MIATALLLVPVVLVLAILLSFVGMNRMLPFTDLATLPFFSIWAVAWSRGNIVRGVITGAIFMCAFLIIGTFLAPATTDIASNADFAIPAGALEVSSLDGGGHVVPWLLALPFLGSTIANLGAPLLVACILVVVGVLACYAAFFARFGVVRPDETVRDEWEGAEAEEEPADEEPAKEEAAKGHREYFRNLIEETNRRSDGGDGTTERLGAER